MSQSFRQPQILELARRDGRVTVDGLAETFGVTVQTVRRDLADLAEAGRLERVHGGAVLPSGTRNIAHEERRALNATAKADMARACAAAIPNGAALFLTIGTSIEALARELLHHEGLMVVTNSLGAADILRANPSVDIQLTGGALRRADGGLVGPLAVEGIERFRADIAVISCSALDESGDMLDYDLDEVAVTRAVMRQARRCLLVADHSKFQRKAPARVGSLSQVDAVYTDAPLPAAAQSTCKRAETEVHITRT